MTSRLLDRRNLIRIGAKSTVAAAGTAALTVPFVLGADNNPAPASTTHDSHARPIPMTAMPVTITA